MGETQVAPRHSRGPSSHTQTRAERMLCPSAPSLLHSAPHPCAEPAAPQLPRPFRPTSLSPFSYSSPASNPSSHSPPTFLRNPGPFRAWAPSHTLSKCLLSSYYTPGTGAQP